MKLIEIISTNLTKMLNSRSQVEEENLDNDLTQFCGKWQDDRDADEIVSQIYADRKKKIRRLKIGRTKPDGFDKLLRALK